MGGLYFGPSHAALFGVYQPPLTDADRDMGIVICNPFGPEYPSSHRALRQLGIRLARVGFHLFRFDYRGTGDSSGDGDEADVDTLKADVEAAIDFLKDMACVSRVSVVGLRLGATLAALVAAQRRDVERLVLWEPVVSGAGYVEELWAMHARWLEHRPWIPQRNRRTPDCVWEVVGYPLTPRMREGIATLALGSLSQAPARRVLVVTRPGDGAFLDETCRRLGASVEAVASGAAQFWMHDDDETSSIVPTATLDTIAHWLAGAR